MKNPNAERYYLAYGSNLNIKQMKRRCPGARIVGTSMILDYELMFKGSQTGAYLTIEPHGDHAVPVAVWAVTPQDEVNLDRYEGYPTFYYKKEMEVLTRDRRNDAIRRVNAFVYIMHEEREMAMPSRRYVETCAEGYNDFQMNVKYLIDAIERTKKGVGER